MEITNMKNKLEILKRSLMHLLNSNEKHSMLLKDYCPWLANFSGNKFNSELEIPGQYNGKQLPLPQHHIKLSGFKSDVCIY